MSPAGSIFHWTDHYGQNQEGSRIPRGPVKKGDHVEEVPGRNYSRIPYFYIALYIQNHSNVSKFLDVSFPGLGTVSKQACMLVWHHHVWFFFLLCLPPELLPVVGLLTQ